MIDVEMMNEIYLMEAVERLQAEMDDNLSQCEIDSFNYNLDVLLQKYHISLERYHEMLLEEMEQIVEEGN